MLKLRSQFLTASVLGLWLAGCGQSTPPKKGDTATTGTTAKTAGTDTKAADTKAAQATGTPTTGTTAETKSTGTAAVATTGSPAAPFLSDDVVGLGVVHPRRLTEWSMYKMAHDAGMLEDMTPEKTFLTLPPEAIEQITLVIDQTMVGNGAAVAGLGADAKGPPFPTLIVSLVKAADQKAVFESRFFQSTDETFEGEALKSDDTGSLWFADDKTFVLGPTEAVKKAITTKKSGKPGAKALLAQVPADADMALVINVASQAELVKKAVEANPIPGAGLAQQLQSISIQVNLTGKPGGKLLELVATMEDEAAAQALNDLAQGILAQGKTLLESAPLPPVESDGEKAVIQMGLETAKSATLTQKGNRVEFLVAVPQAYDTLPQLLKGPLDKARAAAQSMKKLNNLKQIALAFHNCHDTHRAFPGAGVSPAGKAGLSWRVHLLPYLDQGSLYNEFKLDEAWDSEHNKALIAKMPDLFKTEGVTEPGKTSLHVFTGPGAPFAEDKTPRLADITDGSSNTILAVEAGPETAVIWTKPGGLDFDPKDPLAALGTIAEQAFRVVMCDGSARSIQKSVKPETLRKLIQSADGEIIEDF